MSAMSAFGTNSFGQYHTSSIFHLTSNILHLMWQRSLDLRHLRHRKIQHVLTENKEKQYFLYVLMSLLSFLICIFAATYNIMTYEYYQPCNKNTFLRDNPYLG